jgi:hypothetical protein
MREWAKVLAGSVALIIGASAPTIIIEWASGYLSKPTSPPRYTQRDYETKTERANPDNQSAESKPLFVGVTLLDIATLILAGSTVGLWIVTGRSVRIAERALTEVERPYVFVVGVEHPIVELRERGYGVRCAIGNFGRTPAVIERVSGGFSYGRASGPDERPEVIEPPHPLLSANIIGEIISDIEHTIEGIGIGFSQYDRRPIPFRNDVPFFFWLVIEYSGPFTRGHIISSCWMYDQYHMAFRRFMNPQYTYVK